MFQNNKGIISGLKQEDSTAKEQSIIHVMDDSARIAQVRIGTEFKDDIAETVLYVLEDHLGSSSILLETNGTLISKEEYYPFGETSFGSYGKKKYKFAGKERDEESGLYYFGARYYNSWACRFVSVDQLALKYSFQSPYVYADNNPIMKSDPTGMGTEEGGGGDKNGGEKPKLISVDANGTETYGTVDIDEVNVTADKPPLMKAMEQLGPKVDNVSTAGTIPARAAILDMSSSEQAAIKEVETFNYMTEEANSTIFSSYLKGGGLSEERMREAFNKRVVSGPARQAGAAFGKEVVMFAGTMSISSLGMLTKGFSALNYSSKLNFAKNSTSKTSPTGKFYSVAYEMRLNSSSYPGTTRYMHFKKANVSLNNEMKTNSYLPDLGISVPRSNTGSIIGQSPRNWVWHHDVEAGVMQLVPKSQHPNVPGGIFWETLHPRGRGGFSLWGQ